MHFTPDLKAMQTNVDKEVAMLNATPPEGGFEITAPIQQLEVVFSNLSKYYYWHLDKMGLPANWSSSRYLVLEVFATSKQPFDLFIQTATDTMVRKGIKPAERQWTKIVVPLSTFKAGTVQATTNANSIHQTADAPIDLNEVLAIAVSMNQPVGYPALEIRSVKLVNEEPKIRISASAIHP
jgi:hypothetical protein